MYENVLINWGWFLSWQHNYGQSQMWWQTPVILVLKSWRQANQVFKTNFSYIVKLKPVWGMQKHDMASQNKKINYPSNLTWPFPRIQGLDWGHRDLVSNCGWSWDRVYNRNIHRWGLGRKRKLKERETHPRLCILFQKMRQSVNMSAVIVNSKNARNDEYLISNAKNGEWS